MGPRKAAEIFLEKNPKVDSFRVTLYGSLAATGKGHLTDTAIREVLECVAPTEIVWRADIVKEYHTNGMLFEAIVGGAVVDDWTIFSIGGGNIASPDMPQLAGEKIYPLTTAEEILEWCDREGKTFWEYVQDSESEDIWDYLEMIWQTMNRTIDNGLNNDGVLPGGLKVARKASTYWLKAKEYGPTVSNRSRLYAYALATAEENASGGEVVTSPTCGSCGVLPAVLRYLNKLNDYRPVRIIRALATAGVFGNIAKTNASISGAEVGCQGEIGVACAMAAAAACQLMGGTPAQIEYAAEMALEHHLGLTCDPVCGLVQIPCIERNAVAAARAIDSATFAILSDGKHRVTYDHVVAVMKETGHNLPSLYRETAEGGLAKHYRSK